MLGIEHYWLFVVTALALNISPGPDSLYILARTVQQGRRAGIWSVIGISAGCLVHTLAVATGLSALLAASATAFTVIKLVGALYLIWIGIQALRSATLTLRDQVDAASNLTIFRQGLLTNVLNPKVALFFLALLPQFVSAEAQHGMLPFLLLGLTFIATGTVWCLVLVFAADRLTARVRQSPRLGQWINRGVGALMISLGIRLAVSEGRSG
jgi:threonine/homoserine/homoserine lactone efflux protein